jgi:hypothetical protein
MLIKVPDRCPIGPFDFAFIRFKRACNNIHQRGFTHTISSDQTNPFTTKQAK